jgi:hypothetical protein
MYKGKL